MHGFTSIRRVGEFFLSHENIRIPERGKTYSINEGNFARWSDEVRRWNAWIKEDGQERRAARTAQRYVGSLVADAHRTLLKGGIFAYPADKKSPGGKLRLLYEANPLAFIFEQPAARRRPAASASSTSCPPRSTSASRSSSARRGTSRRSKRS